MYKYFGIKRSNVFKINFYPTKTTTVLRLFSYIKQTTVTDSTKLFTHICAHTDIHVMW